MDFLKLKAVEYALSVVVAPLAMLAMQALKVGVREVDELPAWQKRRVVVAVAALFTAIGNLAGVNFGVSGESVDWLLKVPAAMVETAIASLLAMGLHWVKTMRKQKADGGR